MKRVLFNLYLDALLPLTLATAHSAIEQAADLGFNTGFRITCLPPLHNVLATPPPAATFADLTPNAPCQHEHEEDYNNNTNEEEC